MLRFAVRDDDISYFTTPSSLEKAFGLLWKEDVPVSFAVIPFIKANTMFLPERKRDGKLYPVGGNSKLVSFLKNKIDEDKASIMMHGYCHRHYNNGYEFEVDDNLHDKVREGKEHLEQAFDTEVRSFVAPNHAFSRQGMKAVIDNGLNIVGAPSITARPKSFRPRHIANMARLALFRKRHDSIRYPYPLDYGSHRELYCYGIINSTKPGELINGLRYSRSSDGCFCVTVHSVTLNPYKRGLLEKAFRESQRLGSKYVSVDSLMQG